MNFSKISIPSHAAFKINGYKFFLFFIGSIALAQACHNVVNSLALVFFLAGVGVMMYVLVLGNSVDLAVFLFFGTLMKILIPFSDDREFGIFFPLLFTGAILIKNIPRLSKITAFRVSVSELFLIMYFAILLFAVVNNFDFFRFIHGNTGPTGLLARWTLFDTLLAFVGVYVGFKVEILDFMIKRIYQFYFTVLVIAVIMFILKINTIPLFNSFSWSILVDSKGGRRMGVVGDAAVMILIYLLINRKQIRHPFIVFSLLVLGVVYSGGRSVLLSFLFIIYCEWAVRNRVLIRAFLPMVIGIIAFLIFSLSPLLLYIPQNMQRAFIIFPSEFYSGSLRSLAKTSAAASSNFRANMWATALPDIPKHLWLGNGIGIVKGDYSNLSHNLSDFNRFTPEVVIHDLKANGNLHNTFVSILYILGLPALFFFSYVFLRLIYKTYRLSLDAFGRHRDYLILFVLVLLNFLVMSLMGDLYISKEFFIFLAIIMKSIPYLSNSNGGTLNENPLPA